MYWNSFMIWKKKLKIPATNKNSNYIYIFLLSYCLKCRKNTESKNPKTVRTENGRIMLLSKYAVCDSKTLKFAKEQESSGLLSSLGIKGPLNKIPLLGSLFVLKVFSKLIQGIKWMK